MNIMKHEFKDESQRDLSAIWIMKQICIHLYIHVQLLQQSKIS